MSNLYQVRQALGEFYWNKNAKKETTGLSLEAIHTILSNFEHLKKDVRVFHF